MYSDKDGTATEQSQTEYDARIRLLKSATSLLSWLGFAAAVFNGECARENLHFTRSLKQNDLMQWTIFLWPWLMFLSLSLHWKKNPISTYKAGLRGSILSLLIVSSKILARDPRNEKPFLAISLTSLQNYTAILLSIIQALFPRRPALFTPDGKAVDLESSTSALGRYSMHWCTAALALAGNSVTVEKLPVIDYLTRSKSQPLLVLASSKDTLWNLILAERYLGFVKQWTIMLARSVVTFGSPYCVMRLLKSLEDNHGRTDDAWIWLLGVGVFSVCQTVINHHLTWIQWSEMAIPVRAQLMMAIFQKGLRRKDSKEQKKSSDSKNSEKPEVVSLISPEAASFSKFTAVNYMIPASFIRFAFAVLFLSKLLGWQSTLVGMMATLLCVPIHTILIKEQRVAWKRLMAVHNRKMKVVTEALHSLRQIKFSALEKQWEEHIEGFRGEEIKDLRLMATANSIKWTWGVAAPFIVATASICTFAYLEGAITPSIIFPLIKVLPHLQETLGSVPGVFQDYFTARINSKRMDEFLRRPEQKKFLGPSPSGVVTFQDSSIAWPSDEVEGEITQEKQDNSPHRFSLHGIDLQFPVGELSVISGKTGSGKSLLLAAIIGEVELLGGRINAPSMAEGHPVAFVSQTPWLQNATIKDNIIFGSEFDKERYEKVLIACALQPDLAALAKGDETQIGLRGVKLSGGQRARLAFGRALYSRAELLVLDDIFSALDSHVSKEIFNALTGEFGKGRTRILVTHHVSLCLAEAKYMVRIQDNTIGYAGNPDSLGKEVEALEKEVHSTPDTSMTEKLTADASDKASDKISPAKKPRPPSSRTDFKVYKTYFAAAGGLGFTIIYLLGLIVKQLLNALTTWLLGRINSSHQEKLVDQPDNKILVLAGKAGSGLQKYLSLYLWSSLLAIVLEYLFHLHASSGSIRASEILFRQMTARVIRMPILWLDTTPIGEMLRLYTLDMRYVDYHVLESLSEFADFLVTVLTIIGVGLYTSMYTSLLTLILLFWCARVSRSYIRARSHVKRGSQGPIADILEHVTSSLAGLSTIRAFGAVDNAVDTMHIYIDRLSLANRYFYLFNRWLGLQMSFIGILFNTGTGIILLSSQSIIDPSLFGFSLTFSMGLSQAIFKAVNSFGVLESYMDGAGSVISYKELETENQDGDEVPPNWPSEGKIDVEGLEVAYSTDLPLVLKNVSFTVEAGQRLGIVGRTGAGKSSLTLSLLRLLEPRSGSICIDSIDISTVKLKDLRSRIAFIPQDPVLFSGTVRSNLDYFKQVPEDRLEEALRRVKLLAEDDDEKSGLFTLDSPISAGGANMSQGQRQLLCLARVLIKNPKIIVLDEATSAVDNKTDLLIQETIRTDFKGTLIVVAHRLRTIAPFERVMVLSEGKVEEFGSPGELLGKKGAFWELVRDSQDKDFLMSTILK